MVIGLSIKTRRPGHDGEVAPGPESRWCADSLAGAAVVVVLVPGSLVVRLRRVGTVVVSPTPAILGVLVVVVAREPVAEIDADVQVRIAVHAGDLVSRVGPGVVALGERDVPSAGEGDAGDQGDDEQGEREGGETGGAGAAVH